MGLRTFGNLFVIKNYITTFERIEIGYQEICVFSINYLGEEKLKAIFYCKLIKSLLIIISKLSEVVFLWIDEDLTLESASLDFIMDDFKENLIILIDNVSLTI